MGNPGADRGTETRLHGMQCSSDAEMSFTADEVVQFELAGTVAVVAGMPFDIFGILHPVDKDGILYFEEHLRSILCIKYSFCPLLPPGTETRIVPYPRVSPKLEA